ncbi:T9SS type A sorting domain-containing protein [uncultured Polaribacter sp.]|uniref:T9SS type A sorting domain-containing protein n=1 Tax=uncultured Polaribacter sp. TaxID=174711 RepID=UPI0026144D3D|nr:T9SS type A sorting domain-containing protein [uncultured Polaribacter sp.]
MGKFIYLLLIALFVISNVLGQGNNVKPILLKSTVNTIGSSSSKKISNGKYTVYQSIGQSGLVGKAMIKNTTVQQGFLTNIKSFSINNTDEINFQEVLNLVISPNPFVDYIKINFSEKTTNPVYIQVYDINGKVLLNKTYSPTETMTVPMSRFSIGSYIVHIISGQNKFVKKILKTE